MDTSADVESPDVWADPAQERLGTPANVVTLVRTVASVAVAGVAAREDSLPLLLVALGLYWAGDLLDGVVARVLRCESRVGAVLDILADRTCAAAFYVGLVWYDADLVWPVLVYLVEFMVVDAYLSLAFLSWPVRSPNYFYVIDRPLWLWNWSKPGKAANSAMFAVILLLTGSAPLGLAIATALLVLKCASLVRLMRLGLPIPAH